MVTLYATSTQISKTLIHFHFVAVSIYVTCNETLSSVEIECYKQFHNNK